MSDKFKQAQTGQAVAQQKPQKPLQPLAEQNECPEGCCEGNEILCVSIPCPIDIVLLGIDLRLELPCVKLTSNDLLNSSEVQQNLGFLSNLLGALGNLGTNTASE